MNYYNYMIQKRLTKIYLNVILNTVEFSTTSVENPVENYYKGTETLCNSGPYSHLSLRRTDLSSDCIKTSQFPPPLDRSQIFQYNNSVGVQRDYETL